MAKNLVIVESPAKARTLGKYLGRNYLVKASVGHVMDLPKSKLGVDIERDFAAEYHIIQGKAKVLDEIKKAAKDKENVYLAPDPDREGEAIAWHIAQKLGPKRKNVHRVLFNEITKKAVLEALKNPGKLDQNRFEAQQARRILDRLVGYKLSPLLWEKVRRGLSAGRVQSVAVRIIAEREREVRAFVPEEYWTVEARLEAGSPPPFAARLAEIAGQKLDHKNLRLDQKARVDEVLSGLNGAAWTVTKVERKERRRHPTPPFITSRLQQEASRKLGYQPSRTMRIAQRLYEGVEVGDEGAVGLITYMRTDSTRISADAIASVRDYVKGRYGEPYLPETPNFYRSKKDAQDAHEAIRPTSMDYDPDKVARYLDKEELALYTLVWNRFVASQMSSAVYDATAVDIEAATCRFRANGQILKFDGFIRVYTEGRDDETRGADDEDLEGQLPVLTEGEKLKLLELLPEQHFTQPPPRFTQATLIKELEEKGIGRPSTYASIMGTILNKEYVVEDEQRRLKPTELGFLVTDLLVESFPDVLNVEFTAGMEDTLDRIEEGQEHWVDTMRRFWAPFAKDLEKAVVEMRDVKREERATEFTCEKCGQPMIIKWGRRGEFLACRGYPECKNTKNFKRDDDGTIRPVEPETTDEMCEKCGKPMQVRFGRFGKFLGCSGYPECRNMQPIHKPVPTGVNCLGCGEGEMMERRSRRGKLFYSCNRYPDCQFVAWDKPIPQPCPKCGAGFITEKITKRYGTVRRCVKDECGWQEQVDTGDGGDYAPLPERRIAAKVVGRRQTSAEKDGRRAAPAEAANHRKKAAGGKPRRAAASARRRAPRSADTSSA
jgi:DNA topoisomerase I